MMIGVHVADPDALELQQSLLHKTQCYTLLCARHSPAFIISTRHPAFFAPFASARWAREGEEASNLSERAFAAV